MASIDWHSFVIVHFRRVFLGATILFYNFLTFVSLFSSSCLSPGSYVLQVHMLSRFICSPRVHMFSRFICSPGSYVLQVHMFSRFICSPGSYALQVHMFSRFICSPGSYALQVHMFSKGSYVLQAHMFSSYSEIFDVLSSKDDVDQGLPGKQQLRHKMAGQQTNEEADRRQHN
ncbi:hypothetical protein HELRODRAFT_178559 [Helobdella robusta]|uniref:Uncharacterized protein n=1 Tax=Helobdella robusta TaxID=6412 RepID=T1FDD7_HELRO|nr:hypothetical protein HELRODRAFT_178559 [Helobdella robusta]ESN97109.1 hypothetical protein HELRODRAFT_178559 [Helobdella robusta]